MERTKRRYLTVFAILRSLTEDKCKCMKPSSDDLVIIFTKPYHGPMAL